MMNGNYLVWLDLEMTGLDSMNDHILEIATLVTDHNLQIIDMGPEIAIHQSEDRLNKMNDWCKEHHFKSGLVDRVRQSKTTLQQAEQLTLEFLKKYVNKEEAPLCGNSIHQDRNFLRVHMPLIHDYLHYRNIDVSTIKELSYRWFPQMDKFEKENKHTALEDILESVEELRFYKENIFIQTG